MVGLPKSLKKIAKKLDVRVHPNPKLAKRFDTDCGRRYINVSLNMISFFNGVADKVNDNELKGYAKEIEKSTYHRDADKFKLYTDLYKNRLASMGLWKSAKGVTTYEKIKLMNQLRKLGKKVKEQGKKSKRKSDEFRDRGDF